MSSPLTEPIRSDAAVGDLVTGVCELVITGPDIDVLAAITRTLVDERLCACGQLVTPIRSIYRWQGEVCDDAEARVMLHTRTELIEAVVARVRDLHPSEVPCVLALPVAGGDGEYLAWVRAETRGASGTWPA